MTNLNELTTLEQHMKLIDWLDEKKNDSDVFTAMYDSAVKALAEYLCEEEEPALSVSVTQYDAHVLCRFSKGEETLSRIIEHTDVGLDLNTLLADLHQRGWLK